MNVLGRVSHRQQTFCSLLFSRTYRFQEYQWRREVYERRDLLGPDVAVLRSSKSNWSRKSELFAFVRRLGEDMDETRLHRCFTFKSYLGGVGADHKSRAHDGVVDQKKDDDNSNLIAVLLDEEGNVPSVASENERQCNTEYIRRGKRVASDFVMAYLRHEFPRCPEDFLVVFHNFLLRTPLLAHIAANIGMRDLILSRGTAECEAQEEGDLVRFSKRPRKSPSGETFDCQFSAPLLANQLLSFIGLLDEDSEYSEWEKRLAKEGALISRKANALQRRSKFFGKADSNQLFSPADVEGEKFLQNRQTGELIVPSCTLTRAQLFVADFVLPFLCAEDLGELIDTGNLESTNMILRSVLHGVLDREHSLQFRLLHATGQSGVMGSYTVGLYLDEIRAAATTRNVSEPEDKSEPLHVGTGHGESVDEAKLLASRDALFKMFDITLNRKPLTLGHDLRNLDLDFDKRNFSLPPLLKLHEHKRKADARQAMASSQARASAS